jgi:hypothetical protein
MFIHLDSSFASTVLSLSLDYSNQICTMPFDVNDPDPYHTAQPAKETYPNDALRNNAKGNDLDKEALERFKVREICEGWGSYRDAAE